MKIAQILPRALILLTVAVALLGGVIGIWKGALYADPTHAAMLHAFCWALSFP